MPTFFSGYHAVPGIKETYESVENNFCWGRAEDNKIINAFLSGAARDAGNSPTTILRPGLLMGRITATKKFKEWSPTAVDGSQIIVGALLSDLQTQFNNANEDKWSGCIAVGGNWKAKNLLIPGESTYGLDGKDLELLVRSGLTQTGRVILDDEYQGSQFGGYNSVKTYAASTTLTEADNNSLITTLGAVGAVVLTLPQPRVGFRVLVANCVDQNLTITSPTASQLIGFNNAAATNAAFSTAGNKIGGFFEIIGISTAKYVIRASGANTVTMS